MNQEKKTQKELVKALKILKEKKLLLYPTDTIWGLGCDASSKEAVSKIYELKKRDFSKPMILLVESIQRLEALVEIPSKAREMIEKYPKPLTIIYEKIREKKNPFFKNLTSVAIRLTKDDFCKNLIKALDGPIVSTSANFSNQPSPSCFEDIDPLLLQKVDYVVDLYKSKEIFEVSTILKISLDNQVQSIR